MLPQQQKAPIPLEKSLSSVSKCIRCGILTKCRNASATAAKKSETNAAASQQSEPLLHPPRPRKRQKLPPQPGCGGLKRGSEIIRNERILERHSAASSATAAGNSAKAAKTSGRTPGLLRRQRDRAPQLRQAKNSGCVVCQCRVNKCRAGLSSATAAGKSAESAASSASTAKRRLAKPLNRPAQQRGLLPQEDIRNERESVGNQRRILKNGAASSASSAASSASSASASKVRRPDRRQQRRAVPRRHPRKNRGGRQCDGSISEQNCC